MIVAVRAMEKDKIGPSFEDPSEDDDVSDDEGKLGQKSDIKKPGLHDVLLGRGGGTNNHTGNVTFRQLVNKHKMRYLACSKVDKPKVAREVVQLWFKMDPPGRFLQRKDESKKGAGSVKDENVVWGEVGDKKAREKASQCLRERTPDVIPYLSQLRQHQDHMTEQGIPMVQHQMQMNHPNSMSPKTPIARNINSTARRGSLLNMPDRPSHISSMNRRGSMPVATMVASMPVPPTNIQVPSRRTSLPAVSHLQGQQPHRLDMQQLVAHQQQVLRDAYTVIERSGGMNPQRMQMMNQQILADRQAIMQRQYSNVDGPMMNNNMMHNNMMHQNQNQMMQNNMMQRNQMMQVNSMGTSPEMLPPSPTHHHQSVSENYAHMAEDNRSPTAMNNVNQRMAQLQQMEKNRSPVHRTTTPKHDPLPVKNITVTIGGEDDLEPLPFVNEDDDPIRLSMDRPDETKSTPLAFVSPNSANQSDKVSPGQNHHQQHAVDQNKRRLQQDEILSMVQRTATNHGQELEYIDLQPLPLDIEEEEEDRHNKGQQQHEDQHMLESNQGGGGGQAGDAEITLREYRKTLEDYLTNHQISTPAVDIDDDASEEGLGFDGIDASAWIQQALNDSADLSLTNRKSGGRRGAFKEHRENSKKSLMSTDGTSYMSLALSDMDGTDYSEDLSTREHKMSGARSMASSNHSVMSELTDFSDLDL